MGEEEVVRDAARVGREILKRGDEKKWPVMLSDPNLVLEQLRGVFGAGLPSPSDYESASLMRWLWYVMDNAPSPVVRSYVLDHMGGESGWDRWWFAACREWIHRGNMQHALPLVFRRVMASPHLERWLEERASEERELADRDSPWLYLVRVATHWSVMEEFGELEHLDFLCRIFERGAQVCVETEEHLYADLRRDAVHSHDFSTDLPCFVLKVRNPYSGRWLETWIRRREHPDCRKRIGVSRSYTAGFDYNTHTLTLRLLNSLAFMQGWCVQTTSAVAVHDFGRWGCGLRLKERAMYRRSMEHE